LTEILLELDPAHEAAAFAVTLHCQSAGMPASLIATLGTVSPANTPKSASGLTQIPIAASVKLQPNTNYWIELGDADRPDRTLPKDLGLGAQALGDGGSGALQGRLDLVSPHRIAGWARDLGAPDRPVGLQILDNGAVIGTVTANLYREDLAQAGVGNGEYGFVLDLAEPLSPAIGHVIQARGRGSEQDLPGSPWSIEPSGQTVLDEAVSPRCQGQVDEVTRERITGWALDAAAPLVPVTVTILANEKPIGQMVADCYRTHLVQAGLGPGYHGFDFTVPAGLLLSSRQVITVVRARDGAELPGSPVTIEAVGDRDAPLPCRLEFQNPVMSFMMAQAERLADQRADITRLPAKRPIQGAVQRRPALRPGPGWRALVLDERMPAISRDAGSVAILSHMQALQRLGYAVSFAAAQKGAPAQALTDHLETVGISHFGGSKFELVEDIVAHYAGCFDVVYLYRAGVASRCLALARACDPKARILYNVGDLHHLRLQRQAAIEERPALLSASNRMRGVEFTAALSADAVITHTADESAILRQAAPHVPVLTVPWAVPVRATEVPFANRSGLAFVGHYGYAPNEDAACWLADIVMPLVWQIDPDIRCILAGSDMTTRVRELARPGISLVAPGAELHQAVYDQVRVSVAPLRYGAGLTGKVLQSLAAGVPCVMSSVAAAGLDLNPALQGLIGRDAAELASQIVHLHANPAANAAAARAGLSFINQNFTAERVTAGLRAALAGREQATDPLARTA
jgi:glycosyltransferase involved in cell wall biosynthesis